MDQSVVVRAPADRAGRDEAHPWDEGAGAGDDLFGLQPGTVPVRVGAESGPKAHVLVCAPSNSALDEIVLRLLDQGLHNRCAPALRCACAVPSYPTPGVETPFTGASAAMMRARFLFPTFGVSAKS